jgi:parvulin-like peptidyl-prolyl isomerase
VRIAALISVPLLVLGIGCGQHKEPEPAVRVQPTPPGNIRASHILIAYKGASGSTALRTKEEAKQLADQLLARIKAGESFEDIARSYSDCPTAANGGDLGFFTRGRMVKAFEDAAFGLRPGEVSGVIETDLGYHIIKRTQ